MTEPPKPKEGDENCLICGRPKSKHSPEELLTCSRKMEEFKKDTTGGAGIEWNSVVTQKMLEALLHWLNSVVTQKVLIN